MKHQQLPASSLPPSLPWRFGKILCAKRGDTVFLSCQAQNEYYYILVTNPPRNQYCWRACFCVFGNRKLSDPGRHLLERKSLSSLVWAHQEILSEKLSDPQTTSSADMILYQLPNDRCLTTKADSDIIKHDLWFFTHPRLCSLRFLLPFVLS